MIGIFINSNFTALINPLLILKFATRNSSKYSKHIKLLNKNFDKMIMIRFDNDSKVSISVKCQITPDVEREFNLNRNVDEPIKATFEKLYANYSKQITNKSKPNKKLKKDEASDEPAHNLNIMSMKQVVISEDENIPVYLYDLENNLVAPETKNIDAWKEDFIFKINQQEFKVVVNLPSVRKLSISKMMIAGMAAIVKTEFEPNCLLDLINKNSKFYWYFSDKVFINQEDESPAPKKKPAFNLDNIEWKPIDNNLNSKTCVLTNECHNRLIKVVCIPNDSKRDGLAVEHISNTTVQESIDLDKLPMTERHKQTHSYLDSSK